MWTSANAAVVMKTDASAPTTAACHRMLKASHPVRPTIVTYCDESSKSRQLRERFAGVAQIFGSQEQVRFGCLRHVTLFPDSRPQ
jgi:hypothetical protein